MTITIGTSGGNKDVAAMTVGTSGGNKEVLVGTVGTSGGNKEFYVALSASTQATRSGTTTSGPGVTITSNPATVTITGGSGSYTYLWSYVSGDVFSIVTPTASSTVFETSGTTPTLQVGTYLCTVTDTVTTKIVNTNNCVVTLEAT